MPALTHFPRPSLGVVWIAIAITLAGCTDLWLRQDYEIALSGSQEVPPVTTSATGQGVITVGPDKSINGSISTTGVAATAAHIHDGAPGQNGPVVLPLVRTAENVWSVPAGARLTDAQHDSYRAGNLYVNVHSATHPGGEIRGQLQQP